MGSVQPVTSGQGRRWRARWRDPSGRSKEKWFRTRREAERFLERLGADTQRGLYTDPALGRVLLGDFAETWYSTKANLKPSTRQGYRSILDAHVLPRFAQRALASIVLIEVQEWVAGLQASGLTAARVRRIHQVLHAVLDWAVANDYLAKNPARAARPGGRGVQLPRAVQREMAFLTHEEVARLADAVPAAYKTLILVLAYGGLRWGEAVALRRGRCDVLRSQLRIVESAAEAGALYFGPTKNYRHRTVDIPRFVSDALAAQLGTVDSEQAALVFRSPEGGPLRHSFFYKRVWRPGVAESAITGVHPHELRHSFAAFLIAAGAHPEYIKRQMGHSSIVVTMDRYGHLLPSDATRFTNLIHDAFIEAAVGLPWGGRSGEVVSLPERSA